VLAVRDGRIERVQVQTGLEGLTSTELTSGVGAGDVVLLNAAAATVQPGSRVRAALQPAALTEPAAASRRELPVQLD
jgi:HlyD family secretion protein